MAYITVAPNHFNMNNATQSNSCNKHTQNNRIGQDAIFKSDVDQVPLQPNNRIDITIFRLRSKIRDGTFCIFALPYFVSLVISYLKPSSYFTSILDVQSTIFKVVQHKYKAPLGIIHTGIKSYRFTSNPSYQCDFSLFEILKMFC